MGVTATIVPLASGFVFSVLVALVAIPWLRRLKIGQPIRTEGPKSHLKKAGTPTMGGIIFIAGTLLSVGAYRIYSRSAPSVEECFVLGLFLAYGAVGFADDYRKVRLGRNLGLRAREKLVLQILFAALFAWRFADRSAVAIPFANSAIKLGILYPAFVVFIVVGIGNGVNLLDGLDGLAAGCVAIGLLAFAYVARQGAAVLGADLSPLCLSAFGALLGFLVFNLHPAKVIMGDVGALALGALLAALAVATETELVLMFFASMPVIENISVILQVASFQLTGKRIFKMSPLHHHFELSGWKETKVVGLFWAMALVFAFVGLLGMAYP